MSDQESRRRRKRSESNEKLPPRQQDYRMSGIEFYKGDRIEAR